MAARHMKHRAAGGIATAGGNPEVFREAEEKKHGGKAEKRKRGGRTEMHGELSRHRLDRPGRKTGGRVGADSSPLSSANRTSKPDAEPKTQEGGMSD